MNDGAGALQVQSLRGEIGGHENIGVAGAKTLDRLRRAAPVTPGGEHGAARHSHGVVEIHRRRGPAGEDHCRFITELVQQRLQFLSRRRCHARLQFVQSQDLGIDLLRVRAVPGIDEHFPEEHLLHGVGIFFVRKCAAVLALRQRTSAGETFDRTLVEPMLAADALQQRRFARLQSSPQELTKDRGLADQRKLQRIDDALHFTIAVEDVVRNDARIERPELQLDRTGPCGHAG